MADRTDELTAYIAVLREALQALAEQAKDAVDSHAHVRALGRAFLPGSIARAEAVLRMVTGRHAQQDLWNNSQLASEGYLLADYLHHQLYGVPRSPHGVVPTVEEVKESLGKIEALTKESWRLEALLLKE